MVRVMPSAFRDPKSLPDWIELDYYRRRRRLPRLRRVLGWTAFLAFTCLAVATVWPRAHVVYEAGPVAPAHSLFGNDCHQCHTEAFQPARRLWLGNAAATSVSDQACSRCHEGPLHNPFQTETPACAHCHREHRGRPSLARVPDGDCTACHANLPEHRHDHPTPPPLVWDHVTAFAPDQHPEFALWRDGTPTDPGTLRFNHKVHLVPLEEGGVFGPGQRREQLKCADCHRPDAAGRYMQPVSYQDHCARCHVLQAPLTGRWSGAEPAAAAEFRRNPAPHKEPAVVRDMLRSRYQDFARQHPEAWSRPGNEAGAAFPGQPPAEPSADEATWVRQQLGGAERLLFDGASGCRYCHRPEGGPRKPDELPKYARTDLRALWLPRSRFSHEKHQPLRCDVCHAEAATSQAASDVLIAKIDGCFQCHAPQKGARGDCVECHQYHDRKHGGSFRGDLTLPELLKK
jgi:hypothetical protein